jgi:hypothetical protein
MVIRKGQKDNQRSTKYYAENQRSRKTILFKILSELMYSRAVPRNQLTPFSEARVSSSEETNARSYF